MASRSIICRSLRLRQIIDLRDTDKSRYFAITEFNNCFIIRLPSLLFQWISSGSEAICHFHARAIARRRKARFPLRMCRILFAAKHSWTALRMSRPLFVGSYLQVTWWAVGQWKAKKIRNKWLLLFKIIAILAHRVFISLNVLGLCSKVLSTEHCSGRGRDYSIDLSHFLFNMFWFKLRIFIVWSSEWGISHVQSFPPYSNDALLGPPSVHAYSTDEGE